MKQTDRTMIRKMEQRLDLKTFAPAPLHGWYAEGAPDGVTPVRWRCCYCGESVCEPEAPAVSGCSGPTL